MFRECDLKFRIHYYDKLEESDVNKDAFQFGSYIHKIFEEGVSETSLDKLFKLAEDNLSKYQVADEYKNNTQKCLKNFLKLNATLTKTLATEKKFEIELPDNITFNGIIDRVVEGSSGEILVIDYKTSKREKLKKDLVYDEQLIGYAYAASKLYNKPLTSVSVALYYPITGNICGPVKYSNFQVANFLKKLKEDCWSIRKKKKEDFRPNPNKFCDWCGVKKYCPALTPNFQQNINEALKIRDKASD